MNRVDKLKNAIENMTDREILEILIADLVTLQPKQFQDIFIKKYSKKRAKNE
jgi:hypothetical protein